jgi:glyceraldehyde 3-phosphate dehydrogenase
MTTRIGINGFGRIGRLVLRGIKETGRIDYEVAAINDLGPPETNAHLLRHDTVHGRFPGEVRVFDSAIDIGSGLIKVLSEKEPSRLPWRDLGIDIVFECSGRFRKREQLAQHIEAGARRVLVSAPAENADLTVVYGVNHNQLAPAHIVVSNASCTTNCAAPIAHVLHDAIGIENGSIITAHGYTGDQRLVDGLHKDLRRARAAATSMIPTTTGAARAVGKVLPELAGRIDGMALRVPIPNVSVVYLTFQAERDTSVVEIHAAMRRAADTELNGIVDYSDEPLVSADFNHNRFSAVYDATGTMVTGRRLCTVMAWYDNEWGFALRMLDTGAAMARLDANR